MEKEYRNLGYSFLLLLAIVFTGFYKTYFGLIPEFNASTTTAVHFHAFVLTLWVLFLIIQPLLIRAGRTGIHRILGRSSYILAPLVVYSIYLMADKQFHEDVARQLSPTQNWKHLYTPFIKGTLFSIFYVLAIINKRRTPFHMRYMICTGLVFISPSLARVGIFFFHLPVFVSENLALLIINLMVVALIFFDKKRNLNYRAWLVALPFFLFHNISWFLLFYP
ncbi:MAG: hypothetical protein ACHQET_00730 [Chitinophagales bacterium]